MLALNFSKPFSDHSRNPKILQHIFDNSNFEEKQFQLTLSLLVKIAFFSILGVSNHFSLLVFTVGILFVLGKTSSQKKTFFLLDLAQIEGGGGYSQIDFDAFLK